MQSANGRCPLVESVLSVLAGGSRPFNHLPLQATILGQPRGGSRRSDGRGIRAAPVEISYNNSDCRTRPVAAFAYTCEDAS